MKLLITGASGLLGSKIAELSINFGYEVYSAYNQHIPNYGHAVKMDLLSKDTCKKIFEEIKPEIIIHSAALTNVDTCEMDKTSAWKINVEGTVEIANLCKKYRCFMVFISTDYVFDGNKGMYSEEDTPFPINYYGYTKLAAENVIKTTLENFCIIRTSVIYGARPAAGKVNFALWVIESLKQGKQINVISDQIVSPTLNTNLAEMILEIVQRNMTGTYHLTGATAISRYDFARILAKEFDLNLDLINRVTSDKINWIAKRPKNTSLDVSKAQRLLINKPLFIEQAVKKLKEEIKNLK